MVKCKECKTKIIDGEGRYNYPSGTRCRDCGKKINCLLEAGETLIEQYRKITGYDGVRVKHF